MWHAVMCLIKLIKTENRGTCLVLVVLWNCWSSADVVSRPPELPPISRAGEDQYTGNTATCCRRCINSGPLAAPDIRNSTGRTDAEDEKWKNTQVSALLLFLDPGFKNTASQQK